MTTHSPPFVRRSAAAHQEEPWWGLGRGTVSVWVERARAEPSESAANPFLTKVSDGGDAIEIAISMRFDSRDRVRQPDQIRRVCHAIEQGNAAFHQRGGEMHCPLWCWRPNTAQFSLNKHGLSSCDGFYDGIRTPCDQRRSPVTTCQPAVVEERSAPVLLFLSTDPRWRCANDCE